MAVFEQCDLQSWLLRLVLANVHHEISLPRLYSSDISEFNQPHDNCKQSSLNCSSQLVGDSLDCHMDDTQLFLQFVFD